jgi:hypothetical protein
MGEMGALETVFWCWCFLMASSDLPRRASCSLANLALRRFCSGVWAIVNVNVGLVEKEISSSGLSQSGKLYRCVWCTRSRLMSQSDEWLLLYG